MVILPLAMIAAFLAQEASSLYAKVQSGEYDFARYIQRVFDSLPSWAIGLLDRFNLTNLTAVRETLASGLMKGGQVLLLKRSAFRVKLLSGARELSQCIEARLLLAA
jgi:hypothetical protein